MIAATQNQTATATVRSDRDELIDLVRTYAKTHNADYQMTWLRVYKMLSNYFGENISYQAKKAGLSKLDYLESEGMLGRSVKIAESLFNIK